MGRNPRRASRLNLAMTHALLIVVSLLFVFPVYQILKVSFQSSGALLSSEFHVLPQPLTLENYAKVFADRTPRRRHVGVSSAGCASEAARRRCGG